MFTLANLQLNDDPMTRSGEKLLYWKTYSQLITFECSDCECVLSVCHLAHAVTWDRNTSKCQRNRTILHRECEVHSKLHSRESNNNKLEMKCNWHLIDSNRMLYAQHKQTIFIYFSWHLRDNLFDHRQSVDGQPEIVVLLVLFSEIGTRATMHIPPMKSARSSCLSASFHVICLFRRKRRGVRLSDGHIEQSKLRWNIDLKNKLIDFTYSSTIHTVSNSHCPLDDFSMWHDDRSCGDTVCKSFVAPLNCFCR